MPLSHITHILKKRGLEVVSLPIFRIAFEEKYFSCYILLFDQVPLSGWFYYVRYWETCVLQLFFNHVMTSWILILTTGNPAFYLFLYLTGVHFQVKLQHVDDVSQQKNQMSTNQNSKNR